MKSILRIFILLTLSALWFACKKDPNPVEEEHVHNHSNTNDVIINITNVADNAIVEVSRDTVYTSLTPKYVNANNDTFSVTTLKYYISNIKLKRSDGSYYKVPESYFLINAADTINTCKITLKNIPQDNYIAMDFIIGVDSTRNCSGAQTGALDPLNDMFWSWNQGYIFFKFEGFTSSVPNFGIHNVTYHIGGFLAPYNLIRSTSLPFTTTSLTVDADHVSKIYLKANLLEAFRNQNVIDFATTYAVTAGPGAKQIANNYANMFSVAAIIH